MSRVISTILSMRDNMSGGILRVSNNVQGMTTQMRRASQQVANFANNAKKQFESVGDKTVKLGVSMAGVVSGLALKSGFTEAFDMEGYKVQLETATKDTVKAGKLMSDAVKFANKTPFETGEVVQATAKMEMYGLSSKRWLSDVADMAGSTNKSIDQATEAMADIAVGEFERIKEFGIKKDMILAASNKKYGEGVVINAKGQVVDQAKLMDVVQSMMQEKFKGGAEKLANTTKGLWSTITGVTKSSLAKITGMQEDGTIKQGSLLETVKGKIKQVADQIQKWQTDGTMQKIATQATKVFNKLFEVISKVFNFLKDNKKTIENIVLVFASFYVAIKIMKILKGVIFGVQIAMALLNGTIVMSPFGWVMLAITAFIVGFVLLYKNSEKFRGIIKNSIGKLKEFGNFIMISVVPVLKQVGKTIMDVVVKAFNYLYPIIENFVTNALIPFVGFLTNVFKKVFEEVFPAIQDNVKNDFEMIKGVVEGAVKVFGGIIEFITGVFTGDWDKAWTGVKNIFGGIFDGIKSILDGILNDIINKINSVTGLISKIPGIEIGKIGNVGGDKGVKMDIPVKPYVPTNKNNFGLKIPQRAGGTPYAKAGLTLMHEKGGEIRRASSGEMIIPADKSKQLIEKSKGGHTFNFYFTGNVGSNEFFEESAEKVCDKILGKLAIV